MSPFKRPTRANSSSAGSGSTSTGEATAVNSKLSETSPTVTVNTPAYSPSASGANAKTTYPSWISAIENASSPVTVIFTSASSGAFSIVKFIISFVVSPTYVFGNSTSSSNVITIGSGSGSGAGSTYF